MTGRMLQRNGQPLVERISPDNFPRRDRDVDDRSHPVIIVLQSRESRQDNSREVSVPDWVISRQLKLVTRDEPHRRSTDRPPKRG